LGASNARATALVAFPVLFERRLQVRHARRSVMASAQMAIDLMGTVASRAFDETDRFSEWWVPQWHVVDEVMASCPIHDIHSEEALKAFVTIRELYGRMRSWEETSEESWPWKIARCKATSGRCASTLQRKWIS
jgi:hypothetical protein